MTKEQKNIAIAEMLGWKKVDWFSEAVFLKPLSQFYLPEGYVLDIHNYRLSHKALSARELKFDTNANWQFEAIEWIEKQPVKDSEYISNYNVTSTCFGCEIETTGYRSYTAIRVDNKNRKEAIFEALYQFSKHLKSTK